MEIAKEKFIFPSREKINHLIPCFWKKKRKKIKIENRKESKRPRDARKLFQYGQISNFLWRKEGREEGEGGKGGADDAGDWQFCYFEILNSSTLTLHPPHSLPESFRLLTPCALDCKRERERPETRGLGEAKMNYNFTGSVTERRINLGNAHEISSQQLAQQAREERAIRQEIRRQHASATKIQSLVRGRKVAQSQRQALEFLIQETNDFEQVTKLVGLATRRRAIRQRKQRHQLSDATLTRSEEAALSSDDVLLRDWASQALQLSHDSGE